MRKLTALLVLMLLSSSLEGETNASLKVVVSSSAPLSTIDRAELSRLFLKQETRWSYNKKALPVDQVSSRTVRHVFSKEVHRKDVVWIRNYWIQKIFSGRATPPPELSSDEEVLAYVESNAGAIGYVSAEASIGSGVKTLEITD